MKCFLIEYEKLFLFYEKIDQRKFLHNQCLFFGHVKKNKDRKNR